MHNCLFLGVKIPYLSNGIISQEKECYYLRFPWKHRSHMKILEEGFLFEVNKRNASSGYFK